MHPHWTNQSVSGKWVRFEVPVAPGRSSFPILFSVVESILLRPFRA
jgi:hypothetical protein